MMSSALTYPVRLEKVEGNVLVHFPDFPEGFTSGHSEAEALESAPDCLREILSGRIRDNEEIPEASEVGPGLYAVNPPIAIAAKALIYQAFKKKSVSGRKLADILGIDEREVRRILDPSQSTKLDRLEKVGRALGVRLEIGITPI